jgi:hypothetical protein
VLCAAQAAAVETDWKKVDLIFNRPAVVSGNVHRYGLPRSDLKVTLGHKLIKGIPLGIEM